MGSGQETPGEDPIVAGKYAARYVKGLQGYAKGNRLKVAACCKHYTAYDLDNWNGVDRKLISTALKCTLQFYRRTDKVSLQDLADTYNVPFKSCVLRGRVASVMCSYNQVNGKPTCADSNLLKNTIRGSWGLSGYIVSDCDSVGVLFDNQHYTRTPEEAAAFDVNNALANTITVQMRLGMFDGEPSAQPYGHLGPRDVCTPAHQELALEAARQGIVLLKNRKSSLPLSTRRHRTVAVIGPNADVTVTMIGNYAGIPCGYTTPLQGIGRYAKTIHQAGCAGVACNGNQQFGAAEAVARKADATVLVMGLDQSIEAEALDRVGLLLPGHQQELVARVAKASKGPTVLVLMSGGPIDVSFAKNDPRIRGKLPMTWYPQDFVQKVAMTNMALRADQSNGYPGRTYRFYKGPTVFSFGQGLSYTSFNHKLLQAPKEVSVTLTKFNVPINSTILRNGIKAKHTNCNKLTLGFHIDVENTGTMHGTHSLLVFSTPPSGRWSTNKQLVGFQKVHVPAGSKQRVWFGIQVCKHLSVVDNFGTRRIPMGNHKLQIGDYKHSISVQLSTTN
ncbi:beta-d-xylosidase 1 [Quercus suber]|uniref:Beta-d-xylosidase 1 n=1 Tax=Quercus suber TaxID=58331 RepID=A0AAW0KHJ2_QUESU